MDFAVGDEMVRDGLDVIVGTGVELVDTATLLEGSSP
jgi:hypothetical protein